MRLGARRGTDADAALPEARFRSANSVESGTFSVVTFLG
jgi:hypothetical protein